MKNSVYVGYKFKVPHEFTQIIARNAYEMLLFFLHVLSNVVLCSFTMEVVFCMKYLPRYSKDYAIIIKRERTRSLIVLLFQRLLSKGFCIFNLRNGKRPCKTLYSIGELCCAMLCSDCFVRTSHSGSIISI